MMIIILFHSNSPSGGIFADELIFLIELEIFFSGRFQFSIFCNVARELIRL